MGATCSCEDPYSLDREHVDWVGRVFGEWYVALTHDGTAIVGTVIVGGVVSRDESAQVGLCASRAMTSIKRETKMLVLSRGANLGGLCG